ncbi:RluA family pseudouridine synthase [Allobacillus sp. GCM10007491]|uniref:Pseudouridine synthase n=1 Tax=Allobacillus saliphilus TaxID=2912308 RepID=A0A941CYT0_9BACI|nr:RluA family pseudouridine synthase [Allobacillus saliphilus]MBR7554565.1 RluA family pseudouridine synthase [Allobacillus saliphilus]
MRWKITDEYTQLTVRDYLLHVRFFSNRLLKDVKERGEIRLNGMHVTVRAKLTSGDQLEIQLPQEVHSKAISPMPLAIEKVYEDSAILVVNKESGLAVSPNPNDINTPTLANGVMYDYQQRGIDNTFHIVTRLDRNTSGLIVIAKDRYTHHLLQQRQINRTYVAIVEGYMKEEEGVIDLPIGRKPNSIIERMVSETGKRAITHFRLLEKKNNCSFIKIQLETGRTHQIRVHFSYMGHPLVGDDLYGGSTQLLNRQALHCQSLSFIHPYSEERIHFYSHLPTDLKSIYASFSS